MNPLALVYPVTNVQKMGAVLNVVEDCVELLVDVVISLMKTNQYAELLTKGLSVGNRRAPQVGLP
jgi:hypothetical protein